MRRVEKVGKFIGQAIGRKYYGALEVTRRDLDQQILYRPLL